MASVPVVPAFFLQGGVLLNESTRDARFDHYTWFGDCPREALAAAQHTTHLLPTLAPACTPGQPSMYSVTPPTTTAQKSGREVGENKLPPPTPAGPQTHNCRISSSPPLALGIYLTLKDICAVRTQGPSEHLMTSNQPQPGESGLLEGTSDCSWSRRGGRAPPSGQYEDRCWPKVLLNPGVDASHKQVAISIILTKSWLCYLLKMTDVLSNDSASSTHI